MDTFTLFDWFLVSIVAMSTLAAFFRGFIKAIFSLAGLMLGFLLAGQYYASVAVQLALLGSVAAEQLAAFLLILVGVMVLFTLMAGLLRRAISAVGLGLFDRVLGGLFGFARGVLLGAACMMAFAAFAPKWGPLKNSQLAPYFLGGAHAVSFILPEHFAQQVEAGTRHLLQISPELFVPDTLMHSR